MAHCEMFQAGEIQAIIGDASRESYTEGGGYGDEYCGVWSLTSKHRQFNVFGNSFAGLIPSDIRGKSPMFEVVDGATAVLSRTADQIYPVDVRATYQIRDPYYIDHSLTFTDRKDTRNLMTTKGFARKDGTFREVSCVVILILQRTLEYISFPKGAGTGTFLRDTEMRRTSLRLTFPMTSWRSGPRGT